jgi:hypothetical protein
MCKGPDSRGDVAKLVDHLVVVLKERILRKVYLPRGIRGSSRAAPFLSSSNPTRFFFELPALAPDREGRRLSRANRCARKEGRPTLKKN